MEVRISILLFITFVVVSCKKGNYLPATVSDIDGNIYKTVQIGGQLWIAENLKTSKYNDGTPIRTNLTLNEWENIQSGAFGENISMPGVYGYYYNWFAVETGKLCPKGWHIPRRHEWQALSEALGGDSEAGGKLKSTSSLWTSPNTGATNSSGFNALPAGFHYAGSTSNYGIRTDFWSATIAVPNQAAYIASLNSDFESFYPESHYAMFSLGFSCRCLKD